MRRLPPLNALRAFEASARHLSFSRAAGELAVTPAAISHQVRQLEDWFGVPLFRRLNRAVRLTDAGQACLPLLTEGFDMLARAAAAIGASDDGGGDADGQRGAIVRRQVAGAADRGVQRPPPRHRRAALG